MIHIAGVLVPGSSGLAELAFFASPGVPWPRGFKACGVLAYRGFARWVLVARGSCHRGVDIAGVYHAWVQWPCGLMALGLIGWVDIAVGLKLAWS